MLAAFVDVAGKAGGGVEGGLIPKRKCTPVSSFQLAVNGAEQKIDRYEKLFIPLKRVCVCTGALAYQKLRAGSPIPPFSDAAWGWWGTESWKQAGGSSYAMKQGKCNCLKIQDNLCYYIGLP